MDFEQRLDRINELARLSKKRTLSDEELEEQAVLREEYIAAFRESFRAHIEGIKVVDPEGKDVTPEKVKRIQKEKGLHNR